MIKFKAVEVPWRLEGVIETKLSQEKDRLVIKCFVLTAPDQIKSIEVSFGVFYSISSTRLIQENEFTLKEKYNWDNILFRDLFVVNPIEWNERIFGHMLEFNACPDPFVYIIEESEVIEKSKIPPNRKKKFNHFIFIDDEFYTEIIAQGDLSWKEV